MKKRKIMIMSAALLLAGGATVLGTEGVTHAASAAATHRGVIHRAGGQIDRAKLNQAERDGIISAAQKTAFLNEVKTLRTERKSAMSPSSTKAERQAERTKLVSELKTWASTNGFPLAKIFPKLGA